MKQWTSRFTFVLATMTVFASSVTYAADTLCPRGQYTFTEGASGLNEIAAKITLPTPGYKVTLAVGPEYVFPPNVYFRCEKPSGNVIQVLTEYTQSLRVHFKRVTLKDSQGSQSLEVKSVSATAASTAETKKCSSNNECGKGEFCDTTPKCPGANTSGVCMSKPQLCPMIFEPVTGCDGKVYSNRCAAAAEGQPITGTAKVK